MLWGVESHVIERFVNAGIAPENINFSKETFTFNAPYPPSVLMNNFKTYYGPTMNAFEAAENNGKALALHQELETLFMSQNKSTDPTKTSIPASFLKITCNV